MQLWNMLAIFDIAADTIMLGLLGICCVNLIVIGKHIKHLNERLINAYRVTIRESESKKCCDDKKDCHE